MRALRQNEKTYSRYFCTAWKGSSSLKPTVIGGRRPFPPKICAQSDPPPFEKWRIRQIFAYNVSTVRASNRKSSTFFQRAIDEARTLPLSPPKGGLKSHFVVFVNKTQFLSNKICYKVSLCENFQRKSCSITILLSNGPYLLAVNVTLQSNIASKWPPTRWQSADLEIFRLQSVSYILVILPSVIPTNSSADAEAARKGGSFQARILGWRDVLHQQFVYHWNG